MPCRFQAEADDDLKVYDEVAGIEQEQQQDEMDDDEDLIITNDRGFKNEKCPYTLVPVSVVMFGCAGVQSVPWAVLQRLLPTVVLQRLLPAVAGS
jgi:hypothetical protein